jgi:hypothetical protein
MRLKIVFSVLVHEKTEVVLDQIHNFQKFNNDSAVILHISRKFKLGIGSEICKFRELDNVYINPVSFDTGIGDNSQLYAHMENISYALALPIDFEYIALHASNDMFVSKGLFSYIGKYEAGTDNAQIDAGSSWQQSRSAFGDRELKKLSKQFDINKFSLRGSQVEGTFMKREIAIKVLNLYSSFKPGKSPNFIRKSLILLFKYRYPRKIIRTLLPGMFYAKEEVYFPTLINLCAGSLGRPYVFINWKNNLVVEESDILAIMKQDKDYLSDKSKSQYDPLHCFFAVKRVNRDINDPIRRYINNNC